MGVPVVGGTLIPTAPVPDFVTNLVANLVQSVDAGVSGAATPSAIKTGDFANLAFQATGTPSSATVTDTLPNGLSPAFAAAGDGSCSISAQTVTCALKTLPTTVNIAVQGTTAGMYTDAASISTPVSDPNPSNNSASVALAVVNPVTSPSGSAPAPAEKCEVPKLKDAPLSVAKAVLPLLHCALGTVTKSPSKSVPRNDVISTTPGGGATAAAGTKVTIKESSGKKKPKKKKKRK
jgi:hypothetical protein